MEGGAETVYKKQAVWCAVSRVHELAETRREIPPAWLHSDSKHAIVELLKHRPEGESGEGESNAVLVWWRLGEMNFV
jgi:hypothetical protein